MIDAGSTQIGRLIQDLERALTSQDCATDQVHCVAHLLEDFLGRPNLLEPRWTATREDHYARHRVFVDPEDRFCVVAMVWGPGQGTVIHDHGGVWCVEGVYQGKMHIVRYNLDHRDGDRCHFKRVEEITAGVGEVGNLIPPYEYHVMENLTEQPAVTLHVYGRELKSCRRYLPSEDGQCHVPFESPLRYDGE